MTDLHKLLGINKNHVIAVSIPASEYFSFCSILDHKDYKTPNTSHSIPCNYLFIRYNRRLITKADTECRGSLALKQACYGVVALPVTLHAVFDRKHLLVHS